jgi:ABC-type multidrug transport system ATPase subunit
VVTSVSRSDQNDEQPEGTGTGVSADRGSSAAPRASKPRSTRATPAKSGAAKSAAAPSAAAKSAAKSTAAKSTAAKSTAAKSTAAKTAAGRPAAAKSAAAKPAAKSAGAPPAPTDSALPESSSRADGAAPAEVAPAGEGEHATPSKRTAASRTASAKAASARGEAAKSARTTRAASTTSPAARSRAASAATSKRQAQRTAASLTTETTTAERGSRKPAPVETTPPVVDAAPAVEAAPVAPRPGPAVEASGAAPAASEVDETTRERPERSAAARAAAVVAAAAIADDAIADPSPRADAASPEAGTASTEAPAAASAARVAADQGPVDAAPPTMTLEDVLSDAGVDVDLDARDVATAATGTSDTVAPIDTDTVGTVTALPSIPTADPDLEASDGPAVDQAVAVIPAPRKVTPRKKRTLRVARPAPAPDAPTVLSIEGLVKKFGDNTAVDGITLDVRAGSFFGIVGPNGAGKTTTLSMVTGLLRPDAGLVRINGIDAWADQRAAKRATGVLPDRLRLFDRLTGAQLLYYSGVLRGLDSRTVRERSTELIAAFGLEDAVDRLVADYSAGMTKKIALACAMIHAPRLLVLDEPFESVDPVSAANLTEILERYVGGGGTVVLSSHGMDLIERVCDSAAIIVGGRVLASGTLDEVRAGETLEDRFVELAGGRKAAEGMEWLHSFSD